MPVADDLALITEAAKAAGDIALKHFRANPEVWEKDDGLGPVTEADLEVDRFLKAELLAARSDYGWLSEETEDSSDRLHRDHVFIVDPIDGTRAFIEKSEDWAISIAIARAGQVTAGAVFLPAREMLYTAGAGAGAFQNGNPMRVTSQKDINAGKVLTTKPNMQEHFWAGTPPRFKRSFRSSLAYRLSLVAEGRYDAMLTLRPTWEWDVAAGALIVAEAGGIATDGNGNPALFNRPHPQIAGMLAGGGLHETVLSHLSKDLKDPVGFTLPS